MIGNDVVGKVEFVFETRIRGSGQMEAERKPMKR
jgi:hypothetical protein